MTIINLGEDTYFAERKVIKSTEPGFFDTDSGRAELERLFAGLYTYPIDKPPYGDLTVCTLRPVHDGPNAGKYIQGVMHFSRLHASAREVLRKEFPEHDGEF